MPDFGAFVGDTPALSEWLGTISHEHEIARMIAERPSAITIYRNGAALSAQTVRLEYQAQPSERTGSTIRASNAGVLVIGYRDHGVYGTTDIQRGDWFWLNDVRYDVIEILPNIPYCIMAYAEASEGGV